MKQPNQLFYGDNLDVLRNSKYIKDESVDLCYIDPPFNSKRTYNQIYQNIGKEDLAQAQAFIDTWEWDIAASTGIDEIKENSNGRFSGQTIDLINGLEQVLKRGSLLSYLVHMALRITEIHRVLKPTGSFFLHCDPSASHYLKLILDSIFCSQEGEFQNEIIWKRTNAKGLAFTRFASNHDIIFFYTKTKEYKWNPQYKPYDQSYIDNFYKYTDENGRKYQLADLTNPNPDRPNLTYEFMGIKRVWRWTKDRMEKALEDGLIVQTKPNSVPRLKRFLDEQEGNPIDDVWIDISPIQSQSDESLGYPTQKPESLLERIIQATTDKGDVVLDAYCGCGTTVAVAQELNRRWIGIDITYQSISLILKRLTGHYSKKILEKIELNGVPKDFRAAEALANKPEDKTRKEFEKWAVLTYTENRGVINEKKGGDAGIDGIAYTLDLNAKNEQESKKVLFSVKSNKTLSPSVIRDLNGTIERDGAAMGFLITLYPMENLVKESKQYGVYKNKLFNHNYPKIQVVSVKEMLDGERLNLPTAQEVVKSAKKKKAANKQGKLGIE